MSEEFVTYEELYAMCVTVVTAIFEERQGEQAETMADGVLIFLSLAHSRMMGSEPDLPFIKALKSQLIEDVRNLAKQKWGIQ